MNPVICRPRSDRPLTLPGSLYDLCLCIFEAPFEDNLQMCRSLDQKNGCRPSCRWMDLCEVLLFVPEGEGADHTFEHLRLQHNRKGYRYVPKGDLMSKLRVFHNTTPTNMNSQTPSLSWVTSNSRVAIPNSINPRHATRRSKESIWIRLKLPTSIT